LADKNPAIAGLTEDSSGIILAGVRVCCNKRWGRFFRAGSGREGQQGISVYEKKSVESGRNDDAPLSGKAALAMGIPRDGAKSRIWTQADPFVTGPAEDAVSIKLGYVRVGTKVLDTLLLRTFGSSTLGRWPGDGAGARVGLGFCGGTGGPCLWFGGLGGGIGGGSGRAGEG